MFTSRDAAHQRSRFGSVVPLLLILLFLLVILVGGRHLALLGCPLPASLEGSKLHVLCTKPRALILQSLWKRGSLNRKTVVPHEPKCHGVPYQSGQTNGSQRVPEKLVF